MSLKNNPSSESDPVKKSLRASLWEGAASALTVGFAEIYFSPFAIFLGAKDLTVGVLATAPQMIGDFFHLASPSLARRLRSRRRLVLVAVVLQGVILALMPLAPSMGFSRLGFLFGATSLYWIFCSIAVPAWQSWMGELVPTSDRGLFFAERNRLSQLVMFAALLGGGFILKALPNAEGFAVLLGLGVVGRVLALLLFRHHRDVPLPPPEGKSATLGVFLRAIDRTNFGRYVLFATLFSFAVNLSASYFTPYMLTELKFSYLQFMGLLAVMIGVRFLTAPAWGRLIDRYGSRKPLVFACGLFCLAPLLWTFSQSLPYLIFLQVVSGIAAGGFELCSFNFMLENTSPEERTRFAAYHALFTGAGIAAGAVAGGLLIRYAPFGLSPYFAAFLASGLLRALLSAVFLPRLR